MNPEESEQVGLELLRARERRGWSREELARRTKIHVLTLAAIERDDFARLPRGIFIRGFLRAYASEVGADPEAIVRRFNETYVDIAAPVPPLANDAEAEHGIQTSCIPGQLHVADIDAMERRRSRVTWITSTGIVLATIVFFMFRSDYPKRVAAGPTNGSPAAPAPSDVPPPTPPQVGTVGSGDGQPVDAAALTPVDALQIDIEPQGACWVSATADNHRMVYRQMEANEHTRVEGREEIVLRVGDPASFRFAINGVAGRQLGAAGQAVTVRITKQNFQTFLEPQVNRARSPA